jgi:hypothetical protein
MKTSVKSILSVCLLALSLSAVAKLPHIGEERKFMGTKEEFCYDVGDFAKALHEAANKGFPIERIKAMLEKDKLTSLQYKYNISNLYDAYGGYKSFSEEYFQQRAYLMCMSKPLIRSTWDLNN